MQKLEIRCPCCRKCDERVILQLHWTKKHHTMICGHCKLEVDFIMKERIPLDLQIKEAWMALLKFECGEKFDELEAKIKTMTFEEKVRRLAELDKRKK